MPTDDEHCCLQKTSSLCLLMMSRECLERMTSCRGNHLVILLIAAILLAVSPACRLVRVGLKAHSWPNQRSCRSHAFGTEICCWNSGLLVSENNKRFKKEGRYIVFKESPPVNTMTTHVGRQRSPTVLVSLSPLFRLSRGTVNSLWC